MGYFTVDLSGMLIAISVSSIKFIRLEPVLSIYREKSYSSGENFLRQGGNWKKLTSLNNWDFTSLFKSRLEPCNFTSLKVFTKFLGMVIRLTSYLGQINIELEQPFESAQTETNQVDHPAKKCISGFFARGTTSILASERTSGRSSEDRYR